MSEQIKCQKVGTLMYFTITGAFQCSLYAFEGFQLWPEK